MRDERKPRLQTLDRRLLLRGGASMGALAALTGCDLSGNGPVDRALRTVSRWNDQVQAWLFDPNQLAPTYSVSDLTIPFRYNGYQPEDLAPDVDSADWRLQVSGLVKDKTPWTVERLRTLPQEGQITRLQCVEGWSVIGQWGGAPLHTFLKAVGADTSARYVGFKCADRYYSSIDMASAMAPQTVLALDFHDKPLPSEFGFPMRLRIPTKLGFKNPKWITSLFVTNDYPGGYWEDQGYNWFSG
ncbi:MAG: molybdopterin-dependent oxidoreductase, partial [Acetobacteraceae bacterium]|nr:molybdopterin-dependent oxidoreductase [Acetobacteraceae bacterium]